MNPLLPEGGRPILPPRFGLALMRSVFWKTAAQSYTVFVTARPLFMIALRRSRLTCTTQTDQCAGGRVRGHAGSRAQMPFAAAIRLRWDWLVCFRTGMQSVVVTFLLLYVTHSPFPKKQFL